jgi:cell wall-associated NlpC family hydrolase
MILIATALLGACLAQDVPSASASAVSPASSPGQRALEAGRALIGEPYAWGGRGEPSHPGIDCLGLIFLAWGEVRDTPWRRFPVDPSKIVASGMLGQPVPGLDGVLRAGVAPDLLEPGDVLYFLMADYPIPDAPLWRHEGHDYHPWHTGLYAGEGRALHAQPGGRVRHQDLADIPFDALLVTRP